MTAGRGDSANDGPAVSLYERFLWRLFGGDHSLYKRYQPHFADKSKIAEAIGAIGRPVLILVDEILDYVRQLSLAEHADLANQDMALPACADRHGQRRPSRRHGRRDDQLRGRLDRAR